MIWSYILVFLTLFLYKIIECKNIVNAIAFTYNNEFEYIDSIRKFNILSEEKGLNVEVKLNLLTMANATQLINDYGTTVETMLKKKEGKFDIIFYDNIYPVRYGPYLVDLRTVLPKEHIDMYSSGIASETCVYGDKWVGLPASINFSVLYANEEILNEYNEKVPTTWDELIDTSERILKEEKKKNPDSDLTAYNGLFDTSMGMSSMHEMIYSFRNEKNDPFPDLLSENAIKALEKIKEIKERISSDSEFKSMVLYTIEKLMSGRSIFLKYWNTMETKKYKQYRLPGGKPGISGSCVGGSNIGINLFSSDERKIGAALFIEFLTSKETQKELIISYGMSSGIMDLYNDKEVCEATNCELVKSIQYTNRPNKDYDAYAAFFRMHAFEYLYGNKTASQVLHEINDYSKIYKISLDEDDNSSLALLFIGILSGLMMIFSSSLVLLYIKKFKNYYNFLSKDFWFISILGLCLILGAGFLEYGDISKFKCQFKWIMVTFGITLNLIPILHKLLVCFPEENKYSTWIKNNRYIFLFTFILIELILDGLSFIKPYEVNFVFNINNGDVNFEICSLNETFGKFVHILFILYKVLIFLVFLLLIFIEWSIKKIHYEIRTLCGVIYLDLLDTVFLIITESLNIKNYTVSFLLNEIIYITFSLSNYGLIYGYRLFLYYTQKNNEEDLINSLKMFNDSSVSNRNSTMQLDDSKSKKSSISHFTKKIIEYHKTTNINEYIQTISTIDSSVVRSSKLESNSIIN
ncbi:periplasmic binding protein-like II [Piromyces finnis]|uniref:Periplasmic binding protein-like II n=1 Tax=Piromyces finnis TaxID=1754191 RepID=A0A1Y1V5Q0_9FUNG|nr:periplasmic binding protein-like II [Piromyces finnis]|eukprot:ORX46944.1 periplasmic binding protein-like II [Piromyces finnis]